MIEAMVVIAIITIMSMIVIPHVSGALARYHLREAARTVYSDFQLAKLTAIKEGSQCTVTFDNNGYAVYLDLNNNFSQDGSDIVIKTVNWSNFKKVQYKRTTFTGNAIGFLPDCRTASPGGGFGAGRVVLVSKGSNRINRLRIIVNSVGSIRVR